MGKCVSWRRKMRLTFRRFPQLVQAPRTGPSRPPSGQPCRGKGRALQSACDGPGPPGAVLLGARASATPLPGAALALASPAARPGHGLRRPWGGPPGACGLPLSLACAAGPKEAGHRGSEQWRRRLSPLLGRHRGRARLCRFVPSTSPWGLVSRPRKERASGPRGRAHGVGRRGGWRHAGLRPQPGSVPSGGSGRLLTRRPEGPAVPIWKCHGMGPTPQSGQECSAGTEVPR